MPKYPKMILETFHDEEGTFETEWAFGNMKMGYARVSAKDQNPERQLIKFRELA